MISLNEYVKESLLSGFDEIELSTDPKKEIIKFINDNYTINGKFKISNKPNKRGKYVVDCIEVSVNNNKITSLTNGMFEWGVVKGYFNCYGCQSLTSLEGAPKKVDGYFNCTRCNSLKTLEGAPKVVGENFMCDYCKSLTSLKGAPEEVDGNFSCSLCDSLKSLEGAPEKVMGDFQCFSCKSLTSLKGAPKEVGGDFDCVYCGTQWGIKDIKAISKIKGNIFL